MDCKEIIKSELASIKIMYDKLIISNDIPFEVYRYTISLLTAQAVVLNAVLVKILENEKEGK